MAAPTSLGAAGAARARTTIRARSARNRSCERSNAAPSASQAVRATASSGAPRRRPEQPRLGGARGDDLDALLGLARHEAVAGLEQLVQRAAQRAVEQVREALGREQRALERDRIAVGEPDADDLQHEVLLRQPERRGGVGVRLDGRRRQHPGVGLEALAAQVRGQPGEAREVALDLALGDEDAAAAAAGAPDEAAALEVGERGPDRRAGDTQALGQLALRAQPLARPRPAGVEPGEQAVARRERRRPERDGGALHAR